MIRWTPYTFVRIIFFFIAGIVLGIYLPGIIPGNIALNFLIGLVVLYLVLFTVFKFTRSYFNLGGIGLAAIFLAGYVHLTFQKDSSNPEHFLTIQEPIEYYQVVINRYTEEKEKSWKVEAKVVRAFAGEWKEKKGKIVLYFSKNDFEKPYKYGDVLLIKGSPQKVQGPANPEEFDYKRFLAFRNIYHQQFLRAGDVRFIKSDPPSRIMQLAIDARTWSDATLKKFVQGEREQGIASALVLGVTDGLDNELLNAYAATGAMHVLAVSGLHITIVYMILAWILKPLLRLKSGPWILACISLLVLWGYAFITGLSPSVLRAVTMFSFMAVARPTLQSTNIYNTLASSAFCLLMLDPYLIMSVGFQLSYLAVLGIVYLQPGLYRLWEPASYLWDEIWKITTVSIAAQIATFALGLLYFHQFPNYFLLSNLLVIPGSFVVLILGIVVLVVSFISVLATFLGFLLTWSIKILNIIVFSVEVLPFSLIENIHITTFGCWLLMGMMISLVLLIEYKKFSYSIAAFVFVVCFSMVQWSHLGENIDIRKITVYSVNGHTAIDLIDRGHAYFLTDSILSGNLNKIRFHIAPNRLASGVNTVIPQSECSFIQKFSGGKLIRWNKFTIVHLTQKNFVLPPTLQMDWIIIGNNAVKDVGQLITDHPNAKIILDSSNSYFYSNRMVEQVKNKSGEIHAVTQEGALDFNFALNKKG